MAKAIAHQMLGEAVGVDFENETTNVMIDALDVCMRDEAMPAPQANSRVDLDEVTMVSRAGAKTRSRPSN